MSSLEKAIMTPYWNDEDKLKDLANDLLNEYAKTNKAWLQDFFIKRLITRKQIEMMIKRSEYFAEAYSLCRDIQESRLVSIAINGKGNTQPVIMALKHLAGWTETKEPLDKDKIPAIVDLVPTRLAATDDDFEDNDND